MIIWPVFHNKLAYAAGIIDAAGVVYLRYKKDTKEAYAAEVRVIGKEQGIAEDLLSIIGGSLEGNVWSCPANEQRVTLARIMPFLRGERTKFWAGEIIKFRITQDDHKPGARLSDSVREYRKTLGTIQEVVTDRHS